MFDIIYHFYRPHLKDEKGTFFTGVPLFTGGGGVPPLHPIILPPGPMSFPGGTHPHPIILPLAPCPFPEGTPYSSYNTSTGPMSFLLVPHLHPIILPLISCLFQGVPQSHFGGIPRPGGTRRAVCFFGFTQEDFLVPTFLLIYSGTTYYIRLLP